MPEQAPPRILRGETFHKISFSAMASPCELLIEFSPEPRQTDLQLLADIAFNETKRIEQKFSRYRQHNLCFAINNARGEKVTIDQECFRLLEFANECYVASEGLFDLTSGVLRKLWLFDGSNRIPPQQSIDQLLPKMGWQKVEYSNEYIRMPEGMEIDFGGIGKEYAVSRVAQLCSEAQPELSIVVNFGGDLQLTRPRKDGQAWSIGIENPGQQNMASGILKVLSGALATSGDARRFLLHKGKRYSHILNPRTGWPVSGAPRSVTVAAQHCIQAGCLATMALLQGRYAEDFLKAQNVKYWCVWE